MKKEICYKCVFAVPTSTNPQFEHNAALFLVKGSQWIWKPSHCRGYTFFGTTHRLKNDLFTCHLKDFVRECLPKGYSLLGLLRHWMKGTWRFSLIRWKNSKPNKVLILFLASRQMYACVIILSKLNGEKHFYIKYCKGIWVFWSNSSVKFKNAKIIELGSFPSAWIGMEYLNVSCFHNIRRAFKQILRIYVLQSWSTFWTSTSLFELIPPNRYSPFWKETNISTVSNSQVKTKKTRKYQSNELSTKIRFNTGFQSLRTL